MNLLIPLVSNLILNLFANSLSYHYRFLGFTDVSERCSLTYHRYRNTVLQLLRYEFNSSFIFCLPH